MNAPDLTATQAREVLTAVPDTLDVPFATIVGDDRTRAAVLECRTRPAGLYLSTLLEDPVPDPDWRLPYPRQRLAEHPTVGYRTWDDATAERAARKGAGQ